jgi:hypothetical protein
MERDERTRHNVKALYHLHAAVAASLYDSSALLLSNIVCIPREPDLEWVAVQTSRSK